VYFLNVDQIEMSLKQILQKKSHLLGCNAVWSGRNIAYAVLAVSFSTRMMVEGGCIPSKRQGTNRIHGVTSRKIVIFIVICASYFTVLEARLGGICNSFGRHEKYIHSYNRKTSRR
jgi:hypothetical protein